MRALLTILSMAILAGLGCGEKRQVLGKAPKEPVSTILAVYAGDAPANLSVEGKMIEKCPQAGCWFRVEDGTGVIKVDTKAAGFVVTDVPLNTVVKVAGGVKHAGEEPQIQATGMSF